MTLDSTHSGSAPSSQRHLTDGCRAFGHPEFNVRTAGAVVVASDVAWLLGFLKAQVAAGARFRAGESLQVGSMVCLIADGPEGTLCVTEPDMASFPVKFTDQVDNTLRILRAQRDLAASYMSPLTPSFPSLQQSVVVHVNYRTATDILLSRFEPDDNRSGWWLTDGADGEGAQDAARFTTVSLYRLALDRPELVKFMALPPGVQVMISGSGFCVGGADGPLEISPGSFVDLLTRQH